MSQILGWIASGLFVSSLVTATVRFYLLVDVLDRSGHLHPPAVYSLNSIARLLLFVCVCVGGGGLYLEPQRKHANP
jgi:hypothetical protein